MLVKWLGASALVIVLDQLSKLWISSHFAYGESYTVTGFFNLVLAHNTGASFGMLNDAGGWQRWLFSAIAVAAAVWIIWLLRKHQQEKLFCIALALILGGALGNLIDRLMYGYVVDFLDFHWNGHHFAAFNVADSAINIGAALLLWDSFKNKPEKNDGTVTR
ncbi:MAG: lipoprotein signal peptidase [Gallionellaceae bacterium]|nr:MAG: lipoprotein signal peptidase [Gallionellaceae bacterium]